MTAADGELEIKGTKTDTAYVVSIDEPTAWALKKLHEWHLERRDIAGTPVPPWVFTFDLTGEQPTHPDSVNGWWTSLRRHTPALTGVRLHDLRHFAATHLLAAGEPVLTVAARLGHKDPTMILRRYGHYIPGADRTSADIMARIG